MKSTDDVIETLVSGLEPTPRHALERRFALGILPALLASLTLMLVLLGPRPDMAQALTLPIFWIKCTYNLLLALAAFLAMYRLARPDGTEGRFFGVAAVVVAVMLVAAIVQLAASPPNTFRTLILGSSALHCPLLIFAFALPVLAGNILALRRAAPTNLKLAGFISGLAAGASGAWIYSWFCTENGMPFVLIWYSLGIVLCGAVGRWIGPRLLHW